MGKQNDLSFYGHETKLKKHKNYDYEDISPKYNKLDYDLRRDSAKKLSYDEDISHGKMARNTQLNDTSPHEYYEDEYLGVDDLDKIRRRKLK